MTNPKQNTARKQRQRIEHFRPVADDPRDDERETDEQRARHARKHVVIMTVRQQEPYRQRGKQQEREATRELRLFLIPFIAFYFVNDAY